MAHWAARSDAEPGVYAVQLADSRDGGASWRHLGPAHEDGSATEHGFVSLLSEAAGVRAFWLDGRETLTGGPHDAADAGPLS